MDEAREYDPANPVSFDDLLAQETGVPQQEANPAFSAAILDALNAEHDRLGQPHPTIFVLLTLTKDVPEEGLGAIGFFTHSTDDEDTECEGTDPRLVLGLLQSVSDKLRAAMIRAAAMRGDLGAILHMLSRPHDPEQN